MRQRMKRGFSLVELLVVLAVISVLAALLLPAVTGSIERTRLVACMNQMRQSGVGMAIYASSYADRICRPTHYRNPPNVADGGYSSSVVSIGTYRSSYPTRSPYRHGSWLLGRVITADVLFCPGTSWENAASFEIRFRNYFLAGRHGGTASNIAEYCYTDGGIPLVGGGFDAGSPVSYAMEPSLPVPTGPARLSRLSPGKLILADGNGWDGFSGGASMHHARAAVNALAADGHVAGIDIQRMVSVGLTINASAYACYFATNDWNAYVPGEAWTSGLNQTSPLYWTTIQRCLSE